MTVASPQKLKPRKTPRQARAEATVDAILEATIQVLLSAGAGRLTTTRVAARAGVSVGTVASEQPDSEAEGRKRAQVKATREQIVQAVDRFNERIRSKGEARNVTKFDILWLRAMLMIVTAAGQPAVGLKKVGKGVDHHSGTSLQVLPLDDSVHAWPKLIGRTIFTFFGGKRPAIRYLQIEEMHDQIPDDILECWATCFWATQAALCAAGAHKDLRRGVLAMLTIMARL
jgi:AcrR family transcriptional regulator